MNQTATLQRRKLLDLALEAGRLYQSSHTGFIHLCHEGAPHDTIPLLENFCFALALLRSRQADHVTEARDLIKKLCAFEVSGAFPFYLHHYPACFNEKESQKIYAPLYWINRLFGHLIDLPLNEILARLEKPKFDEIGKEWALVGYQMGESTLSLSECTAHYYTSLHRFFESDKRDGTHPELTLYELFMSQLYGALSSWGERLKPVHILGSLIFPFEEEPPLTNSDDLMIRNGENIYEISWGDSTFNHSLVSYSGFENDQLILSGEFVPDKKERTELDFYLTYHPETDIWVNGVKATTFQPGDEIRIVTPAKTVTLKFTLVEGEGRFFGQISRSNRPTQIQKKEPFAAFDWRISLRTIERENNLKLSVECRAV